MAMWFRSHASKLDNPKVQRLTDAQYRAWDSLLCVACKYDGVMPPLADIAFMLRRSRPAVAKLIETMVQLGLFVRTDQGLEPHDWNDWQFRSDSSKERMRRHRHRHGDVTATVTVTPSESEAETENRREAPSGLPFRDHRTPSPVAARGSLGGSAHASERGDGPGIAIAIKRMAP